MTKTDADRAGGTTTLSARLFAPGSRLTWLAALLLLAVGAVWVLLTPEGILGKADAVGYAVCHRIAARSFTLPGGRPVPLCARCSGTFLGVLVGLLGPVLLFGRRRAGGFPRLGLMVVMLGMTAWWGFDGANSFAHLIPREGIPRLYEPVLGRWWELLALYGTGAALIAMVYSEVPVLLYPLALLSAVGVVTILAAVMTVFVTTLLRRENRARTLADAVPLVLLGLTAALVMIGGIDAVRYAMFGTWDGFVPPA